MPQSISNVLVHVVFSTYLRIPMIPPALEPRLHEYMGGALRDLGCGPIRMGGVDDHVHLFFALSRTVTIAKAVEKAKTASTNWIKEWPGLDGFHWQKGYGAFSVGERHRGRVIRYIAGQHKHHGKITFQDEYLGLLEEHGMPYDPRYVWE